MDKIYHITSAEQWGQALREEVYRGDTLDAEGFIHCSSATQVVPVANAFFLGQRGLVLLCIDSAGVRAEIRHERGEGEECFPHIYGPLDVGAVFQVLEFEPGEDGTFALPAAVAGL